MEDALEEITNQLDDVSGKKGNTMSIQELTYDGYGLNLKKFDEHRECIYCERVATMQPRFKGQYDDSIGKLLAMAMVLRDTLKIAVDALDIAQAAMDGPDQERIQSAHTLAKAIHRSAQSVYTGDQLC